MSPAPSGARRRTNGFPMLILLARWAMKLGSKSQLPIAASVMLAPTLTLNEGVGKCFSLVGVSIQPKSKKRQCQQLRHDELKFLGIQTHFKSDTIANVMKKVTYCRFTEL